MIKGAWVLLTGLRFLLAEQALRPVLWKMLGILLLLVVALTFIGMSMMTSMVNWLTPLGDDWYIPILSYLAWMVSLILTFTSALMAYFLIAPIATAPWLDDLARITEEQRSGRELPMREGSWHRQLMQDIINALRPLFGLIPYGIVALLFLLLPLVGGIVAALIWGYGTIRFLNFALIDTPASRRGWNYGQRKREIAKKPLFYLGLGGTAMIMMLIPLLNLLTLPAAVVGLSLSLPAQNNQGNC
ncbi:MAG: EI24 domain-containing protein [Mariprofundaceae bacterium]